jgi:hypothetical protein
MRPALREKWKTIRATTNMGFSGEKLGTIRVRSIEDLNIFEDPPEVRARSKFVVPSRRDLAAALVSGRQCVLFVKRKPARRIRRDSSVDEQ